MSRQVCNSHAPSLSSTTAWTLPQPWTKERRPPLLGSHKPVSTSAHTDSFLRRGEDLLRGRGQRRRRELPHRLGAEVAALGHGPPVILFEQDRPHQANDRLRRRKDADDVRAPLNLCSVARADSCCAIVADARVAGAGTPRCPRQPPQGARPPGRRGSSSVIRPQSQLAEGYASCLPGQKCPVARRAVGAGFEIALEVRRT